MSCSKWPTCVYSANTQKARFKKKLCVYIAPTVEDESGFDERQLKKKKNSNKSIRVK